MVLYVFPSSPGIPVIYFRVGILESVCLRKKVVFVKHVNLLYHV